MEQTTDLADRYGAPTPWRRRVLIAGCVVVVAAFLGWLGWTIWDQSTPQVRSDLVGYDVVDEHRATATVEVRLADDDVGRDLPAAGLRRGSHGRRRAVVHPGGRPAATSDVRTERRATSVELVGCTAPGQRRPR